MCAASTIIWLAILACQVPTLRATASRCLPRPNITRADDTLSLTARQGYDTV